MIKIIFSLLFAATVLSAADTVTVQTLTFDSIYTRRGVWTFPDNPNEYRKILMSYTLKCDPKTPHDKFNCGEWDYLTYTTVHQNTGEYDTTYANQPVYMIGRSAPDTIYYSETPQNRNYEIKKSAREFISGENENIYSEFNNEEQMPLNLLIKKGSSHIRFLVGRDSLRNSDLSKAVQRLKIKTNLNEGDTVKNIKIKAAYSSDSDFQKFDEYIFTDVYDYHSIAGEDGVLDFVFNEEFTLNPLRGILFDIAIDTDKEFEIQSADRGNTLISGLKNGDITDYFMQFDGEYDFIETDINEELSGVNKFSIEGWFRIDEWKQWTHLFGKGSRTVVELGPEEGQLYCMIRSYGNTHGNIKFAVQKGKWFHLAMIFDGSGESNRDKLKLYINGIEKNLAYTGSIPSRTENNDIPFTISSLRHNTSALNGAADNIRIWNKVLSENDIINRMYISDVSNFDDSEYLIANYHFNNENDEINSFEDKFNINLYGMPQIEEKNSEDLFFDAFLLNYRPDAELFSYDNIEYNELDNTITYNEELEPVSILEYELVDGSPEIINQQMVWLPGYVYDTDAAGNRIDSVYYEADNMLINDSFEYISAINEKYNNFEIGRFITPYGINLDLGPDGFEWMYDVTDYAPLLTGEVELSAGNLQELIDLKFYFIKGTPARKVEEITQIWGARRSHSYANLDEDKVLSAKEISLNPDANQFKVKTRLTGHGHHSNTGEFPHCCEWKDNTHYLYVNGNEVADWKIFRYTECGENPVFPQGGTWPGAREGWCPGDIVYDYEYEVTDYITGNNATFDYDITDVPANNEGMGKGNYVVAMHLIQYAESEFDNDAEIYDVITPNNWDYYSRKNPICNDPVFKVRNNGTSDITSLTVKFGVSGNDMSEYTFDLSGSPIAPNQIETLQLSAGDSEFWLGNGENIFTVEIAEINGIGDEYPDNNISQTDFEMPDLFEGPVIIVYKTNLRANHFSYEVLDANGEQASDLNPISNNRVYRDTLYNSNECMTFNLTDQYSYGLSYWAYPDQGSGYLRIENIDGDVLKSFNPDFGRGVFYSFRIGELSHVNDAQMEYLVNLYPNPAKDVVTINSTMNFGNTEINIYDLLGNRVTAFEKFISEGTEFEINISNLSTGDYFIEFKTEKYRFTKRFLKK